VAKIVSFINFKGGVGKTTSAVEIAVSLAAHHGKRVLLVDLDPQTNATFYLVREGDWSSWVQERGSLKDLFDSVLGGDRPCEIRSTIMQSVGAGGLAIPGLHLLPSHLELISVDLRLAGAAGAGHGVFGPQTVLASHLRQIAAEYDYILCDCPPNFNLITQNGMFASEAYVVPMLPDFLSTIGITLIRREIENFTAGMRRAVESFGAGFAGPELRGVIFSRVRVLKYASPARLAGLHAQMIRSIRDDPFFGPKIFRHFIPESVHVGEAPARKIPASLSPDGSHRAIGKQFRALAAEFLERV